MKMQLIKNRKNLLSLLKVITISLPVIFLFWLIGKYGVNVIFWDDLEPVANLIDIQKTGKIDWEVLLSFQNEHRIVIPRIIILITGALTHYNTKIMMFISALLISVAYIIFIKQTVQNDFSKFTFLDIVYSLVIGFCLFNCAQYENLLWGFQIAWFLIEFCVIAGLAALSLYLKTEKNVYIVLALIFAFISSFSSLHGLAIWPCYIAVIAIYQIFDHKFDKKIWGYILLTMLCTCFLYFQGYPEVAQHAGAKGKSVFKILNFSARNLGSVLSGYNVSNIQFIFGISELFLTAILALLLIIKKQVNQNIFPIGIIIFSFGIAFMLGMGRSGWDIMPSRYMTFPLLAVVGNLAILRQFIISEKFNGVVVALCFLLLSEFCIYSSWNNMEEVEYWYKDKSFRAKVLKNYKTAPYRYTLLIYPHFKTKGQAIERIEKIEKANLSVFYKGE